MRRVPGRPIMWRGWCVLGRCPRHLAVLWGLFYVYKDTDLSMWSFQSAVGHEQKMKTVSHLYAAHRRGHREGRKDES